MAMTTPIDIAGLLPKLTSGATIAPKTKDNTPSNADALPADLP